MWDLPGPGIEPLYPAVVGGFLTAVLLGKPDNWFLAYFNILIVFVSPTVFPIWPALNPHHCWYIHLSLTSFFIVPRYSHSVYTSSIFQTVLLFVSRGGLFIMTTSSQCLVRRNSPSRGGLFVCLSSWTNTTCIERLPMTSVAPARHKKGTLYVNFCSWNSALSGSSVTSF